MILSCLVLSLLISTEPCIALTALEGCTQWYYGDCPPGGCAHYNGQPERDHHSPCEPSSCAFDTYYIHSLNASEQSDTEFNSCLLTKFLGQSLHLSCKVELIQERIPAGDDQQWLWWDGDNGEGLCRLQPNGWLNYTSTVNDSLEVSIHLENLGYQDAASYLCLYSNDHCNYNGIRNLSLKVKDPMLNVSSEIDNTEKGEGGTVVFTCRATAFLKPDNITWLKDNQSLSEEIYNIIDSFPSPETMLSTLKLQNLQQEDSGVYKCIGIITEISMKREGTDMKLTVRANHGWKVEDTHIVLIIIGAIVGLSILTGLIYIGAKKLCTNDEEMVPLIPIRVLPLIPIRVLPTKQ